MASQVDAGTLENLLALQNEDSAIRRLTHRKETLTEAERLSEVNDRLAELNADIEIARKQTDEIAREQNRIEGEIELVDQKIEKEEKKMFAGSVSNPKELSALQAEVESLKRKKGGLEDQLLEVMVQRDQSSNTLAALERERGEADSEARQLAATVSDITAEIDAELGDHSARREEIAATISTDLLDLYDRLRTDKGGIGAAALVGDTCEGCHTKLPAKEVERLRGEGGLQRCDNCRRILVVTR